MRGLVLSVALACAGCENAAHDMYMQPRLSGQQASPLFADQSAVQLPPAGTVVYAAGVAADASSGSNGRVDWPPQTQLGAAPPYFAPAASGTEAPAATDIAQMQRGRQRYQIDCSPCHGLLGDGNGIVAQRGFPHPPSYHQARLRAAADAHFDDVIVHGYGVMFPYGGRVSPDDRRAVIAYIRALQLSQNMPVSQLDAADRQALEAAQ